MSEQLRFPSINDLHRGDRIVYVAGTDPTVQGANDLDRTFIGIQVLGRSYIADTGEPRSCPVIDAFELKELPKLRDKDSRHLGGMTLAHSALLIGLSDAEGNITDAIKPNSLFCLAPHARDPHTFVGDLPVTNTGIIVSRSFRNKDPNWWFGR